MDAQLVSLVTHEPVVATATARSTHCKEAGSFCRLCLSILIVLRFRGQALLFFGMIYMYSPDLVSPPVLVMVLLLLRLLARSCCCLQALQHGACTLEGSS
jgi:hypothetical protein